MTLILSDRKKGMCGLAYCAEQIHLDNGDTLIVRVENVISLTSGDRVSIKYKELGVNENCPPGINCEVFDIEKIENEKCFAYWIHSDFYNEL
jgi:hypothetical protein